MYRLAMGDKRLLVGCLDDAGVVLFDIKQLLEGSVGLPVSPARAQKRILR
jgi:hypothetical protein